MCGLKEIMRIFATKASEHAFLPNLTAGENTDIRVFREVVIETCAADDRLKNDCPFPVRSLLEAIICGIFNERPLTASYILRHLSFEIDPRFCSAIVSILLRCILPLVYRNIS